MVASGVFISSSGGKDGFNLPQSWQDHIVNKFERLEVSPFPEQASPTSYGSGSKVWHDRCLPKYHALLEIMDCTSVHPSTNARIAEILQRKLKLALRPSSAIAPEESRFIVGRGFDAFSHMSKSAKEVDVSLEPLLRAAAPRYARLPSFLKALISYEKSLTDQSSPHKTENIQNDNSPWISGIEGGSDILIESLVDNLSTNSHDLRILSIQLLDHLYTKSTGKASDVLATMLLIEQTPLDLQSARSASMHIRKLASMYQSQTSNPVLSRAIPSFCFGMFTVKFAQLWEDSNAALVQIAETTKGENTIAEIAFRWLEAPSTVWDGAARNVEQSHKSGLTDFECSNLTNLQQLASEAETELRDSQSVMVEKFESSQELVPAEPPMARAQALKVLAKIPRIAERRSRQLVPMFLSWAKHDRTPVEVDEDVAQTVSDWTRRDQKAQLDIFCLFNNPRVLYKSEEVHGALLALLANGDLDIQKSALKAILTWKSPSIKPYEESLLNLLDEARFKDELTILLQGETKIQPQHRPELMPVLLRILYGRTISKKGAASGRQGMEAKRLIVLRNLGTEETGSFLQIALGELQDLDVLEDGSSRDTIFDPELISVRKQVGFMNMMEDVLKELSTHVAPFTRKLLPAILYCVVHASRKLRYSDELNDDRAGAVSQTSMLKVIRQTGLKCLVLLFTTDVEFDWSPFFAIILEELVSPRLENLPIETAQGVSGILQLLSTWSSSPRTVLFLGKDDQILVKVIECIAPQKSKDQVKLFALKLIDNIINIARGATPETENVANSVKNELLSKNMDCFLLHIGNVLRHQQDISKELLEACVETISGLAPFVTESTQAYNLVDIATFLLDQPTRRVNPKTKSGLLLVLEHFVPLYNLQNDPCLKDRVYHTVTSLFGFFRDRKSREVLSRVLKVYSQKDPVLGEIAGYCTALNSFAEARLDEPDYDRRLKAFIAISKERETQFTPNQWRPLVYNMLFYIRHDEEFGVLSSNSSDGLCNFLNIASQAKEEQHEQFLGMLSSILLPALYAGAREPSEIIRREYVKVMAHLVKTFPDWNDVGDMHILLQGDDELEGSFFNNILSAGKGRQSSALGQLATTSENGEISSRNTSQFFIPLIEHFIFDRAEGNDAHNLAAEATTCVGVLVGSLDWPQYRAVLRRFIGYITAKPDLEKQIIRLLGKVIDRLAIAAEGRSEPEDSVMEHASTGDMEMLNDEKPDRKRQSTLSGTLPKEPKFTDDLCNNIIPPLTAYLHDKDETTVSLRVPVAVIVVRLLKLLPYDKMTEKLPPVLTDICHILRSKAQEARDMTRDTLTTICVLLGPSCFGFVLKELRGALARGSQLHVLSYTMHSILVATTPLYSPGDLDYCLSSIVAIIMDDIFGVTGQEKDAEEYVSKMKEVKNSKSQDSMELIAATATLSRLTDLVRPIQVLLKEKLNIKMVRKIDELLNRISTGLLKNSAANSRDSLIFCYEVIQDVYNSAKPQQKVKDDHRLKKYLVQKGAKKSGSGKGGTTVYTYKLIRFAFDVLRSVLKKHDSLRTSANLAGFVPIIGDSLVQGEEEVKISAFKLLTTIAKVPLKTSSDGTNLYKVAAAEAIRCINASSSTSSDVSQAALKLISVILRDRKDVLIKETSIDSLLERMKEDMTDPDRRHVTFNFLRSVLDSKIETATIYDSMDYVGTIMVTNDDKDTRDLARGAYFQFLREYPQKKSRWQKQLSFIVANLNYEREGGRLSILEVLHLLLSKSSSDFVQEVSATCFVPLIFVLVNDESEKCRMAAGEILKEIFKKADKERTTTFLGLLRNWLKQSGNPSVQRLAFQSYGFYYEAQETPADTDVEDLQNGILETLQTSKDSQSDWELIYSALQLASILCDKFPSRLLSTNTAQLWAAVRMSLTFPHAWVKLSAAKLIGTYLTDFARVNVEEGFQKLPLRGSNGLKLSADDVRDLIKRTAHMFKTPGLTQLLADEIVKNLFFLTRCAAASSLKWKGPHTEDNVISEDEDDNAEEDSVQQSALNYLFSRLSFILRREISPPRAPMLVPKQAALQLLQVLISKLDGPVLIPSLQAILLPLHNLTDRSIPAPYSTDDLFKTGYEKLKTESQELMEQLKVKCGTASYTEQLLKVRQGVRERREQRSSKRKIEAVSAPEKYGKDKQKKTERKKERRKEKGMEHRDQRKGF
jgi:U3 small nucleolar RNA-associated protein 20